MRQDRNDKSTKAFLLVFSLLLMPAVSWGQKTATPQPPQAAAPATPNDPLKRDTPYGTVTGFLKAAGQKNYELAAKYVQMPHGKSVPFSQETLEELEAVLNHDYYGSLDMISREPEGILDDGLRPDLESIGKARIMGGNELDIRLIRLTDTKETKIWLVSAETVRQIPDFYRSSPFTALQNSLPHWMSRTEVFSLTVLELADLPSGRADFLAARAILDIPGQTGFEACLRAADWARTPLTGTPLALALSNRYSLHPGPLSAAAALRPIL